jgi:hypothetical protein
MPTYDEFEQFLREYRALSKDQRAQFRQAVRATNDDLKARRPFLDPPHACRQGMRRLRMWYPTTLAPAGPARPDCTVERRMEAPLKRPYSYLFSHRGEQTERPFIPRSKDRGHLAAER